MPEKPSDSTTLRPTEPAPEVHGKPSSHPRRPPVSKRDTTTTIPLIRREATTNPARGTVLTVDDKHLVALTGGVFAQCDTAPLARAVRTLILANEDLTRARTHYVAGHAITFAPA